MGLLIDRDEFEESDYERFTRRLGESLAVLRELLERPDFGDGERTLGAEIEVSIIDSRQRALPLDRKQLPDVLDDRITLEFNRFNLEYNMPPLPARGPVFAGLRRQIEQALATLDATVREPGGRVVPIGILPTLATDDLRGHVMTDLPRFRALAAGLRRARSGPYRLHIDGKDRLEQDSDDVTMLGAGTSFQLHLRVSPGEFARMYNAAQLATPPALAIAANSPFFLGQRLWDETRVALFRQAVDGGPSGGAGWRRPARISLGRGWVCHGAHELFAEAVALFPPLLPVTGDEDPGESLLAGRIPGLDELRLHQGTVWRWNRAVYDPGSGGHLRIEMRALPSGPAPIDMAANAAFLLGLTAGLAQEAERLVAVFPFEYLQHSFHRAAQHGLDARLLWPSPTAPSPREIRASDLIRDLIPVAERGLEKLGVEAGDAGRMLDLIRDRLRANVSPARWQRRLLESLETRATRQEALAAVLERYVEGIRSGEPVHEWSDAT